MKTKPAKTVEQFLKEIQELQNKIDELKKFEANSNAAKNRISIPELKSLIWLEKSPVCTKIVDLDFNLQYMSNSGVSMLKIEDITNFYGKPYPLGFYPELFKSSMQKHLQETKTTNKTITFEAPFQNEQGHETWFQSTLIPINDEKDKLDYILVVSLDITTRKQAELKLIENEDKLNNALEITKLGTFSYDDNTGLFETSSISDLILGIDDTYIRDVNGWVNLVHPEDYENAQQLLDNSEVKSISTEFRIVRPVDKKIIWILGHAKKEFDQNGERTKVTGTIQDVSERKTAEKNLRLSELRLREAQSVARIGSFEGTINDDELWWSEELFNLFGLKAPNLNMTKEGFDKLVHPDDKDQYMAALTNCLETGKSFKKDFRGKHTSGEWLYFETVAGVTYDSEGKIFGLRGTVQDITERKKAEQIIRENQIFNESLLKTTPDIIYVYDLDKKTNVYTNDGNYKVLGYTAQEIIDFDDKLVEKLLHPEDFAEYKLKIIPKYNTIKDGEVIEYINRLKHKKGHWIWMQSKEIVFKRENDKAIQIFGIAEDVTKRKEAEERLKIAKARLKNTFDLSPSIIATVDVAKNQFIDASAAVTRILGYSIKEFTSKPFYAFIHPEDLERTSKTVEKKLKKHDFETFENRYICKDGTYKWISWQGTKPNSDGEVTAIGTDVTERKKVEIDLKRSAERFERWKSSNFIGIIQSNAAGDIIDANDTILNMLGYTKKEMQEGKLDWTKLTPPEFLHLDMAGIKEAEEKGYWTPFEKEYFHKDGHRIPIIIGGSLFEETQKEFIVFVVNLTESKKIEKDLKESEQFLNLTGEIAKVGGWELNLLSKKVKWSRETKRIHEVDKEYEPSLETAIDFYHEDDRELVKKCVSESIEKNKPYNYEARIITAKGNLKHVKAIGHPVFEENTCVRLYGAFQDITERKKIDAELETYRKQLETENILLKQEISLAFNFEDMVYSSVEMSNVLNMVEQVSTTDANVLIQGETGTGKELIAKAIHNTSRRKNHPLIRVNCGAIPSELIESELFGHIKGSFTGAINNRIGKFELADGGTLFLDEIGEMPIALQPKLLRAIQEGEIEPIGSSELRKLDVRIIAATNKNLKEEIEKKHFREDLYFRLNVFPINVPALRDRISDIPVLTEYFVTKYSKKHGKDIKYISDITMSEMKDYNWPGNVRELENLIERAVIISNQDVLIMQDFDSSSINNTNIKNHRLTLDQVQRNHILKTLKDTSWKIDGADGAAELLDIKPSTLRDRMKKLGIERPS